MTKKEKTTARKAEEIRELLADRKNGRDEMNLAELPIFLLSTRAPTGILEREFEFQEFDARLKQRVRRKLTVIGSPRFGLPTAPAEEVSLGLIHLTKATNDFSDPRVYFSRRELLKTIGWPTTGPSYERLARCMGQISGVRLHCENYWRDNRSKEYRSVENIAIIDYYRFRDSRNPGGRAWEDYLSEFRWGSVVFESFTANYLKKLNLELALHLSPLARHLYRFLDKRFHPPRLNRISCKLKVLAYERLGMSRSYDTTQIRRQLEPAIVELVRIDFLRPIPAEQRFQPVEGCRGQWRVMFEIHPAQLGGTTGSARAGARRSVGRTAARPASNRPEHQIVRAGDILRTSANHAIATAAGRAG